MIKATELRLKNLVQTEGGGVYELTMYDFEQVYDGKKKCYGIPLTSEWLERFGFSNEIEEELPEDAEFLCFFKDNIDIELQPSLMGGTEVVGITLYEDEVEEDGQLVSKGKYEIKTDVFYVHQLQNLYFCLVGEELTLKP